MATEGGGGGGADTGLGLKDSVVQPSNAPDYGHACTDAHPYPEGVGVIATEPPTPA